MRRADRREVLASSGPDVRGTVARSVTLSANCLAVRSSVGLLAIFGTAPLSLVSGEAAPWLLGTPLLFTRHRTLGRVARRYIGEMARAYPVLVNHVDARNAASIRLLAWLGFTIGDPAPYGAAGLPFRRFELRSV